MATSKKPDGSISLSQYRDQHYKGSRHDQEIALLKSTTMYVGNLSYYTSEEQIHELFGRAGDVKRIVMGLDKVKKTPCGFCFVEYYARPDAENCMRCVFWHTGLDSLRYLMDEIYDLVAGSLYGQDFQNGYSQPLCTHNIPFLCQVNLNGACPCPSISNFVSM